MFHTAELQLYTVSYDVYNALFEHGYKSWKGKGKDKNKWLMSPSGMNRLGIQVIKACTNEKTKKKDEPIARWVQVVINFSKLVTLGERANAADVATEKDYPAVKESFQVVLQSYFPELDSDIEHWKVNRIDYCINLRFTNDAMPGVYTALLNRGKPYPRTADQEEHDDSLYRGNNTYRINFYDKFAEQKNKIAGRTDLTEEEKQKALDDVHGVLRLEVQKYKSWLYRNRNKYDLEEPRSLVYWMQDDIAKAEVTDATRKVSPEAPYRTRSDTIERIKMVRRFMTDGVQDDIIAVVDAIDKARSHDAIEKIWKDVDKRKLLDRLYRAHINPVTIKRKELDSIRAAGASPAPRELPPLIDHLTMVVQ